MKSFFYSTFIVLFYTTALLKSTLSSAQAPPHVPWIGVSFAGIPCNGKAMGYGPYDYTKRHLFEKELYLVESAHFTPEIENLNPSLNLSGLIGDLDYTLRAWPNHHRALNSIIRLQLRNGNKMPEGARTSAECYLQRAIGYSNEDGVTYMLYGMLLARSGLLSQALESYQKAEQLAPKNMQIKYNMGLLLIDLKEYTEARKYAEEVYSNSFPLPGLKRKLTQLGYWD